MRACHTCAQRQEDPEGSSTRRTLEALAAPHTVPACFKSCQAVFDFVAEALLFRYRLACGHVCERHAEDHRCCLCRGLSTADSPLQRTKRRIVLDA